MAPEETLPCATLKELFDDGVRCGSERSLRELAERITRADREIEDANAVRSRLAAAEERVLAAMARDTAGERSAADRNQSAAGFATHAKATEGPVADMGTGTAARLFATLRRLVRFLRG